MVGPDDGAPAVGGSAWGIATALLDDLEALVSCESPSGDQDRLERCATLVEELARRRTDLAAERVVVGGHPHLRWRFGTPRVVLVGHLDTVWPAGTLARWPFGVVGDQVTGPGVFDMKAGLLSMLDIAAAVPDPTGLALLVTSDEETGSATSRDLIADTVRGARAALVLEPSADGALKVARKGVGTFRLDVGGRAAHAGLEPHLGVNAAVEVAHQVLAVTALADPALGTTVTPTVLQAGTTVNTVPAAARVAVDVRAATVAEMERVRQGLRALAPRLPGATVALGDGSVRLPLQESDSAELFARAQRLSVDLGLAPLRGVAVGGGSDGNLTAAAGVPTLDGLGAVGGGAHAEGEWVSLTSLPRRTALVAALVRDLLDRP